MSDETRLKAKQLYFKLSDGIYHYQDIGDSKRLVYVLKELERFYTEINDIPPLKQVSKMLDKGEPFDFWDMDIAKGLLHGIYEGPGWKDEFLRLPFTEF